jgi:hypothetical protein
MMQSRAIATAERRAIDTVAVPADELHQLQREARIAREIQRDYEPEGWSRATKGAVVLAGLVVFYVVVACIGMGVDALQALAESNKALAESNVAMANALAVQRAPAGDDTDVMIQLILGLAAVVAALGIFKAIF